MRCGYGLQEDGVKFLGVEIDENLDRKLNIKSIQKKIGKGNYLLWRFKNRLSDKMKKVIYESFVRTHVTYSIPVWGAKNTNSLTELKKFLKKTWSKIGQRRVHTNSRLSEHKILKLVDEIKLAEMKIIWRWEKKKLPFGLKNIRVENNTRVLRSRQFVRDRRWKTDNSIANRLSVRATKEIMNVSIAISINGLKKKIKITAF
jgi:hypothetical protein